MSTAIEIDSRREVLSDQSTRGCCIDRLSWQGLSVPGSCAHTHTTRALPESFSGVYHFSPLCNLTLPIFDSRPRRAYTHTTGFALAISGVVWSSHQLGRDADACDSQHHHRLHLRFFHSDPGEADFSSGIHGAVQSLFRTGSLVRHAAAVCLATGDLSLSARQHLASPVQYAVSVFLRDGFGKDLGKAALL